MGSSQWSARKRGSTGPRGGETSCSNPATDEPMPDRLALANRFEKFRQSFPLTDARRR
jgi:hypothetical protein